MNSPSWPTPRRLDQRGLASLEFAVVASVFFMLMLGSVEVGRYLTTVQSLRNLTGEAARAALVAYNGGTPWSAATVKGLVPFLDSSKVSLTVTPAPPACSSHLITATASYPFTSIVPYFSSVNGSLTTAAFTTQITC